jgi:membrane protease YdiL (CAAX protease family)
MNKEIKIALVVLIGFLSFLWLEKPLREYLSDALFNEQIARKISSITIRISLIAIAFYLIKKFRFVEFTGLDNWQKFENLQAVLIAIVFIIFGFTTNFNIYANAEFKLLLSFAISTLAVGIFEELAFRGIIFPLLIKSFSKSKRPILISAVLSSFLFGIVHFINLFSQPENIIGITSQVFFATAIGVFFCGLMVRTENILIPCIIHALINFSFGAGELKPSIEEISSAGEASGIKWSSVIPTTIFFTIIFIGGIYMILKSNKAIILGKLKE